MTLNQKLINNQNHLFMRIFTKFFIFIFAAFLVSDTNAQNRYLDQVFSDVEVKYGDEFGVNPAAPAPFAANFTILRFIASQGALGMAKQPLLANMYYPKGDTETNRPLIIYVHTGNFFPYPANGSCGGTMRDSSNVEIATRLAKMGYVVAVVNYRQGWNPRDPEELIRRFFLINAAYRGVQDMNTYVRYFRRTAADFGNPHGIDPSKITIWGQGTGGYLSLASAYLKSYPEIFNTANPLKFILTPPVAPTNIPMVIEPYNGTINADGPVTRVDATYNALSRIPIGDTLCIPNHVGFSSEFALCVNMGGALGDSTWLSQGEVPLISFHVDSDAFAPVETNILNVPTATGPQPVVEVSGSRHLARRAERFGNNNIFKTLKASQDPYAASNISGYPAYYEFTNTPDDTSSPWEWSKGDNPPSICNKDAAVAKRYIDTIVGYFAPRACLALNLPCKSLVSGTNDLTDLDVSLLIAPNPAKDMTTISVSEKSPIRKITLTDITGRVFMVANNVNASRYELERAGLNTGLYLVKLDFDKGSLTKKIVFE
jgi:hypothetical protein